MIPIKWMDVSSRCRFLPGLFFTVMVASYRNEKRRCEAPVSGSLLFAAQQHCRDCMAHSDHLPVSPLCPAPQCLVDGEAAAPPEQCCPSAPRGGTIRQLLAASTRDPMQYVPHSQGKFPLPRHLGGELALGQEENAACTIQKKYIGGS